MKKPLILLLLVLAALMASFCKKVEPSDGPEAAGLIRFEVMQTPFTRSMIVNDDSLKLACTPVADGGKGQSIALWASMKKGGATTNDVFKGVKLEWVHIGEKGHESNPDSDEEGVDKESYWNTMVDDGGVDKYTQVYWHPGETYYFRAYYPNGIEVANNTSASTFIAEYNTKYHQDDLMAAYQKKVLTTKPELQEHVQLSLKHMLSAVRFTFRFKNEAGFENSDRLTGLWLENTEGGQFGEYALLVYGIGTELPGADSVKWYIMDVTDPGEKMYEWTNAAGIPFHRNDTDSLTAEAYKAEGMVAADKGSLFTQAINESLHHYVYMIPQDLHPGTQICFTTQNSAGHVFRVNLPTSFKDASDQVHTRLDPGYRYTFNIVISRLDIDVLITIKEWNKLDSSYLIDF